MPNDFDPSEPVGDQSDAVRAKYARRVERFRAAAREPTLFVRRAWDDDELDWLLSNAAEAQAVLRRSHPGNALVVVTAEAPSPASSPPLPVYGIDEAAFRHLLVRLRYPMCTRFRNLIRHHRPILAARVRARVALRTRARLGRPSAPAVVIHALLLKSPRRLSAGRGSDETGLHEDDRPATRVLHAQRSH